MIWLLCTGVVPWWANIELPLHRCPLRAGCTSEACVVFITENSPGQDLGARQWTQVPPQLWLDVHLLPTMEASG